MRFKWYRIHTVARLVHLLKPQPKVLLWTLWRSGTHWLADMLSDLMKAPTLYSAKAADYKVETLHQLRTHSPNSILVRHICMSPAELLAAAVPLGFKTILLYRDSRDVLASHVNMRKYVEGYREGLPPFPDMSIDDILKWELETYGHFYAEELPAWVQLEHPEVLKIRYEDLHADTFSTMRRTAAYLGLSLTGKDIEEVVERYTFARRTRRSQGDEDRRSHFRKGVIGDYRNQFTAEQLQLISKVLESSLESMGYD